MPALRLTKQEFLDELRAASQWQMQFNRDKNALDLMTLNGQVASFYESPCFFAMLPSEVQEFMDEVNTIAGRNQGWHIDESEQGKLGGTAA